MEMTGEQLIHASQAQTWAALNDPAILKECVPGCESIERTGDNEYVVLMTARVGPVAAKFKGRMTLSNIVAPDSYSIAFEGQGGVAGFAKGSADVALAGEGQATRLAYKVKANVGGKLAQIGSRLIDATARKMAEEFFTRFAAAVGSAAPEAAAATAPSEPTPTAPAVQPKPAGARIPAYVWAALLTGIIAVLLYLYTRG